MMRKAVREKFMQNSQLAVSLRATGDADLIEDSTTDAFWGAGADGRGKNWLGRVLLEVRAELGDAGNC
ncbi:MAG: NADAR domain-containing protein [Gemmataceae bacterium]